MNVVAVSNRSPKRYDVLMINLLTFFLTLHLYYICYHTIFAFPSRFYIVDCYYYILHYYSSCEVGQHVMSPR